MYVSSQGVYTLSETETRSVSKRWVLLLECLSRVTSEIFIPAADQVSTN